MAWRDRLGEVARLGAAISSDALRDFASADFRKADNEKAEGQSDEGNDTAPGGSHEDNASNAPAPEQAPKEAPQSLLFDPFAVVEQLGYKERPSQISYGTLRAMVWRMPIVHAVIQARVKQVQSFARVQRDRFQYGFQIRLRDRESRPTKQDIKFKEQMETFMLRTGVTNNPRGRDGFTAFLAKIAWDTLVYDQMCFETIPNRKGQPAQFVAVDGSTIRLADVPKSRMLFEDPKETRYVQVYDGVVINEYSVEEMAFGIRNPRTDIKLYGYGTSELEMLAQAVTALLWGWDYNARFFSQGSVAKGILNIRGEMPESQLQAFRRHWYTNLSSIENAWRTPVTNANEGLEWVNLQQSNRDMEFSAWIDFLIKIVCSAYQMDPVEVNFKYGNEGQRSAMNEAGNREKLIESRERGLRPLLEFIANAINMYLIWPINESFEFAFVGLDARTPEEQAELNQKRVKTYRTVNELRAEEDLPPIDGGDVILDPTYAQLKQAAEMGAPGEEGGEPEAEGEPVEGEQEYDEDDFNTLLADLDDEDEDEDVEKSLSPARKARRIRIEI